MWYHFFSNWTPPISNQWEKQGQKHKSRNIYLLFSGPLTLPACDWNQPNYLLTVAGWNRFIDPCLLIKCGVNLQLLLLCLYSSALSPEPPDRQVYKQTNGRDDILKWHFFPIRVTEWTRPLTELWTNFSFRSVIDLSSTSDGVPYYPPEKPVQRNRLFQLNTFFFSKNAVFCPF